MLRNFDKISSHYLMTLTTVFLGVILLSILPQFSEALCVSGTKNVCCSGKNSSCFSYERNRQGMKAGRIRRCYCDASCTKTRDCCQDYYIRCKQPPKDCSVGVWSAWGACSKSCGAGQMTRHRSIYWREENGGKSCPNLKESRFCRPRPCPIMSVNRSLRESAQLLPAKGNVFRAIDQFNMKFDIRRNLYHRVLAKMNKTEIHIPPYCVQYDIVSETCPKKDRIWTSAFMFLTWVEHVSVLETNKRICVTCLPNYMKSETGNRCLGTGALGHTTRWSAAKLPNCQGTFRMVTAPRICTCPSVGRWKENSFLFI